MFGYTTLSEIFEGLRIMCKFFTKDYQLKEKLHKMNASCKELFPTGEVYGEKFVGRKEEKERFKEILEESDENGIGILIKGRKGFGKSSFLRELEEEFGKDNMVIFVDTYLEESTSKLLTFIEGEIVKECWDYKDFIEKGKKIVPELAKFILKAAGKQIVGEGVELTQLALASGKEIDKRSAIVELIKTLESFGDDLKENKKLIVVLDDIQKISNPNFLVDVIDRLPPNILFVMAIRIEDMKCLEERYWGDISSEKLKEINIPEFNDETDLIIARFKDIKVESEKLYDSIKTKSEGYPMFLIHLCRYVCEKIRKGKVSSEHIDYIDLKDIDDIKKLLVRKYNDLEKEERNLTHAICAVNPKNYSFNTTFAHYLIGKDLDDTTFLEKLVKKEILSKKYDGYVFFHDSFLEYVEEYLKEKDVWAEILKRYNKKTAEYYTKKAGEGYDPWEKIEYYEKAKECYKRINDSDGLVRLKRLIGSGVEKAVEDDKVDFAIEFLEIIELPEYSDYSDIYLTPDVRLRIAKAYECKAEEAIEDKKFDFIGRFLRTASDIYKDLDKKKDRLRVVISCEKMAWQVIEQTEHDESGLYHAQDLVEIALDIYTDMGREEDRMRMTQNLYSINSALLME